MSFSAQSNLQKNSVLTNKVKNLMKTYDSCTDTRAYSLEANKRNKYLLDILNGAGSSRVSSINMNEGDGVKNQSTGEEVKKLLSQIQALQNELKVKQENISFLQKTLEDFKEVTNKDSNSDMLKRITKENKELKQRLIDSGSKSSLNQKNSNEDLKIKIQELENQLSSSITSNEDLKQEALNMQKKLTENLESNAKIIQKNSNANFKTTIQELENKLKSSIELNEDLKKEVTNLRKNPASKDLNDSILKLENKLHQKTQLLEKSESQLFAMSNKFREMENRIKKIERNENKFDDLVEERNALQALNVALNIKFEELNNLCQTFKESKEMCKKEMDLYRSKYADLDKEKQCIQESCHLLKKENESLKSKNDCLIKDLQATRKEINEFTEEFSKEEKNCCKKCEERFAILIDLQNELKETQEQIMIAIEESVLDDAVKRGISDHHSHNLVETVNYTLSHISNEFEKRKSLERELDGFKHEMILSSDDNLNIIEELKGTLAVRNDEIRVLKGQLVDLEERLQSENLKYKSDLEQLYQEVEEFEKVKESNDSLKKQIVELESSENYEIVEKEVQTDDSSSEELNRKIEELIEVNRKLEEENQNLIKDSESISLQRPISENEESNKKIAELMEVNQKLQEENQNLIKKMKSESSPQRQLSTEMYRQFECKHRQIIKDLQMAHEKEKLILLKEMVPKTTQSFSGITRTAFTKIDKFCTVVLSEGFKNFSFFDLREFHDEINKAAATLFQISLCGTSIPTPIKNLKQGSRRTHSRENPNGSIPPRKKLEHNEINLKIQLCAEKNNFESKSKAQIKSKKIEKDRFSRPGFK